MDIEQHISETDVPPQPIDTDPQFVSPDNPPWNTLIAFALWFLSVILIFLMRLYAKLAKGVARHNYARASPYPHSVARHCADRGFAKDNSIGPRKPLRVLKTT